MKQDTQTIPQNRIAYRIAIFGIVGSTIALLNYLYLSITKMQ
jgi:hypothetical protein